MSAAIHNEEHRQWARAKIVVLAKSILSGEVGVVAEARQLAAWRFDVDAEHDPGFIFFVGVDSETDHLPVGKVRRHWSSEALGAKDDELVRFEASTRERAFEVCQSLIQRYETHTA
jgi:hypothetical protein